MEIFKKRNEFTPVVITPPSSLELPDFRELWEYKGLFLFLVRRDIKLRFQQTVIGFLWIVLQPLIQMVIFYIILGVLVKVPTGKIPYHLFFLSAFVVWQFFSQVVTYSTNSLVGNIGIIIKSYFPRLALPLASVASLLVDFGISILVLLVFSAYRWELSHNTPVSVAARFVSHHHNLFVGVGLLFGALTVVFRDMRHLMSFILMIWMYVTPVIYPRSLVPEQYQILLYFNPLTSLVESFQWVFLHQGDLPKVGYLLISFAVALLIWFSGAIAFRAMENKVADVM